MVVRVLQFSDTHLFASKEGTLKGVNTYSSLESVLRLAKMSGKGIDFVVLTGDLSQDETLESYQNLAQLVSPVHNHIFYIPGNHDSKPLMKEAFASYANIKRVGRFDFDLWSFIFLDSAVEGKIEGNLSEAEMKTLQNTLDASTEKHVAIFMHHNPVTMDARRIDAMMLQNHSAFLDLIGNYENVKAVVCGHVHQDLVQTIQGKEFIASPSTCVQFCPTATGLTIDRLAPGYRFLEFRANGSIDTNVARLDVLPEGLYELAGDL